MQALTALEAIVRDALIFVVVMTALLMTLLVVVSRMPADNPLKRMMVALSYRVGATLAVGALAAPAAPISGLDALVDVGGPIALVWFWWTFIRDLRAPRLERAAPAPGCGAPLSRSRSEGFERHALRRESTAA